MDLELSFSIPSGFTVTIQESPGSDNITSLTGSSYEPCQALDLAVLGWTPTPNTVISIERDWMMEFYESEDCTGSVLRVQFDHDELIDEATLAEEGWFERITSAVLPVGEHSVVTDNEDSSAELLGGTSQPLACQSLGGSASQPHEFWVFHPDDLHDTYTTHVPDFEFYKNSDCSGAVFARSLFDDPSLDYSAEELGSYSTAIRGVKARASIRVDFPDGESILGEEEGSFECQSVDSTIDTT